MTESELSDSHNIDQILEIVHAARFESRTRGQFASRQIYREVFPTSPYRDVVPPTLLNLPPNDPFRVEVGVGEQLRAIQELLVPGTKRLDDGLSLLEALVHTYRDFPLRFVDRIHHYQVDQAELLTRVGLGYLRSGELRRAIDFSVPAYVRFGDPRSAWIASVAARGLLEGANAAIARIANRIGSVEGERRHRLVHPLIAAAFDVLEDDTWASSRLEPTESVYPHEYIQSDSIIVSGRTAAIRQWHFHGAGKRDDHDHPEFRVLDWMIRNRARAWNSSTRGPLGELADNARRTATLNLLGRLPDNYATQAPVPDQPRRRLPRIRDHVPRIPTDLPDPR